MINALDLGFVRESRESAAENTARLSQRFTDEVYFPAGEYSFRGTAQLPARSGLPPIRGVGHPGWPRPSGDTQWEGAITRWTQLDGFSAIAQFNGDGGGVSGIEVRSRMWYQHAAEGPQEGSRAKCAFIIHGDPPYTPPTGLQRFSDLCFTDFEVGILTTGTNNADNSLVDNCCFKNCDWAFRSTNAQTVNWHFRDCHIGFWGGAGLRPLGIADMVRGGDCRFDFTADALQLTGIRVCDYSENTSDFAELNIRWDQPAATGNYLTAFEYAGDPNPNELGNKRWTLSGRITVNNIKEKPLPTVTKCKAPRGLPTDGIKVEVVRGAK